jgi:hypothetical protein
MKATFLSFSILFIFTITCLYAEVIPDKGTALFSTVTGQVLVRAVGGKARKVHKQDKAFSGEVIQVGASSEAVILMADGSSLDLMANSRMALATLKQDTPGEKNFLFKLGLGKVVAMVTKLMTAHSSFEIEAGGVICGVRGTEFSMSYDPKTDKGEVQVRSGVVAVTGKDKTLTLSSGKHTFFQHGNPLFDLTNPGPPSGRPASISPAAGPGAALSDLIGQYNGGIRINNANGLSTAQQTLSLHLIVPPSEGKP